VRAGSVALGVVRVREAKVTSFISARTNSGADVLGPGPDRLGVFHETKGRTIMERQIFGYGKAAAAATLLGALALTAAPGPATAQDAALDHFKCYFVLGEFVGERVLLQDQFDRRLEIVEEVLVGDPVRFCNPVVKFHGKSVTEISNKDHHLTFYQFDEPNDGTIVGAVKIANQFGEQTLKVQSANILAVPTQKQEDDLGVPEGLDHFKCYFASGRALRRPSVVGLKDQFESLRHKLREPHYFCNPVKKEHLDGKATEIRNPDHHLTCYRLSIEKTQVRDLVIANQFTDPTTDLVAEAGNLLCVPTKKLDFKVELL
jgi:hypothetical protein